MPIMDENVRRPDPAHPMDLDVKSKLARTDRLLNPVFYDLPSALPIVRLAALRPARRSGDQRKERNMWKVGDVEPVRVMGAEGYPYGFNVTTEDGKSVVSLLIASRALAEQRQHIWNRLC